MFKVLVVLLLTVALCYGQSEIKRVIDPYTVDTRPVIIILEAGDQYPVSSEASTQDASILGGERDLLLTVESGSAGLLLSTGVSNDAWNVGTPNSASGFAIMQYDGSDGSSALNRQGLGGIDLTENGASAFRALIQSDIQTNYVFRIFSGNAESSFSQNIPGNQQTAEYLFNFSQFSGNADFTNVGAIEIQINAFDNVDTLVSFFGTHGPVVSPTSSPAPGASHSPTPAPVADEWYTFDDDDNGVSPCTTNEKRRTYFLTESNIIYYYFYGFNDPYANHYFASANSAAALGLSAVLALCTLVILF